MDWQTAFLLIAGIGMAHWMRCTMRRESAIERQLDAVSDVIHAQSKELDNISEIIKIQARIRECERLRDAEKEAK